MFLSSTSPGLVTLIDEVVDVTEGLTILFLSSTSPGLVALVDEVVDVAEGLHGQLGEVLHIGPQQRMLAHTQAVLVAGVQQVPHTLTVDLHVADL